MDIGAFTTTNNRADVILAGSGSESGNSSNQALWKEVCAKLPLRTVMAAGEIQVCGNWANDSQQTLRSPMGPHIDGGAILLIGDYIGPYYCAAGTLIRHRLETPTRALPQLSQFHLSTGQSLRVHNNSYLCRVEVEHVQRRMLITLTQEQCTVIQQVKSKFAIEPVAGSGKSTAGVAIVTGVVEVQNAEDDNNETITWALCQTRAQRDDGLESHRELSPHPLNAIGLGRATEDGDNDEQTHGPRTEEILRIALQSRHTKYTTALSELQKWDSRNPLDQGHHNERRRLAEKMTLARANLGKARHDYLTQHFQTAKVVCMTLGCALQITSGKSTLSSFPEQISGTSHSRRMPTGRSTPPCHDRNRSKRHCALSRSRPTISNTRWGYPSQRKKYRNESTSYAGEYLLQLGTHSRATG